MKKKTTRRLVTGCLALAGILGLAPLADAGTMMVRRAARAQRMEASEEAAAALTAVGAAQGWGRIKVEDSSRRGIDKREVEVDLFDMAPTIEFSVEADGVFLGTITTDASGWGSLKLETDDDGHSPVPAGLPAADDLVSASVRDTSDAFVLEGSFVGFGAGDDNTTVHEEKISLDDVMGSGASGVAKVEREADGTQEFDTRATGLMPGASFTVMVDGFTAGMTTADPVGQARLELESPDDSNPLPTELQPVEDLRVVEWLDSVGDVVLAGIFTGMSNDDDIGDDNGNDDNDDDGDDHGGMSGDDDDDNGDDNGGIGNNDDNDDGDDNGGIGNDDDDDGDDNGGIGNDDDDDDDDDGDDNGGNGGGDDNGGDNSGRGGGK